MSLPAIFRNLAPTWFAAVMGTGIVANAAALLPLHIPGLQAGSIVVWALASTLLVALVAGTIAHWALHADNARRHHHDPATAPFYGAPPIALMTVGAGALLVGKHLIGLGAAVRVDEVLWSAGTVTGLLSAVAIPYFMFTVYELEERDVSATWLLPVVPPMVSALTGPGLIAHLPAGQDRLTLLLACLAMFGIGLFASMIVITLLWRRLALYGPGPAVKLPALWVVLGPLGSSITALALLAHAAPDAIPAPYPAMLGALAVLFGVPVWGFAMLWLAVAATITGKTARDHLPFSLTWWSFTFPWATWLSAPRCSRCAPTQLSSPTSASRYSRCWCSHGSRPRSGPPAASGAVADSGHSLVARIGEGGPPPRW